MHLSNASARFVLAALIGVCALLTVKSPREVKLISFSQMVPVERNRASVLLDFPAACYQLKIKHAKVDPGARRLTLNGKELRIQKSRRKKSVQTDYLRLMPNDFGASNRLEAVFAARPPSDIDVRLSNYIPVPLEALSDDLFLVFRGNYRMRPNAFWFLLYAGIAWCALFAVWKIAGVGLHRVRRALMPSIFFIAACAFNNLLPLTPFTLLVSPFFFLATLLLSAAVMAVLGEDHT